MRRQNSKWRSTKVKKEQWTKIDGWYVGRMPKKPDGRVITIQLSQFSGNNNWITRNALDELSWRWRRQLAHECANGRIRAASWFKLRQTLTKGLSVYGKCAGCGTKISEGIKTLIRMNSF